MCIQNNALLLTNSNREMAVFFICNVKITLNFCILGLKLEMFPFTSSENNKKTTLNALQNKYTRIISIHCF